MGGLVPAKRYLSGGWTVSACGIKLRTAEAELNLERFAKDVRGRLDERGWNATRLAIALGEGPGFAHMAAARTWLSKLLNAQMREPLAAPVLAVCAALTLDPADYDLPRIPAETIPVIAFAAAGDGKNQFTDQGHVAGEGMYRVERPADVSDPHAFGVEVEGDSMAPRFLPGEVVVVDTRKVPANGDDVVVGLISGERYIKRWSKRGHKVTLESWNRNYSPIVTSQSSVQFAFKIVWHKSK